MTFMSEGTSRPSHKVLEQYLFILVAIWTVGIASSLGWNLYQLNQSILNIARNAAEINYDKDVLYRQWVSLQGGVYVPVSPDTPSNPYLEDPHRDIKGPGGQKLTLINPAYMTRLVHELAGDTHKAYGHITSMNPIRPANAPDAWENQALKRFEKGAKEAVSVEKIEGKEYLRYMRPFTTETSCLKCHAKQGYKVGDIRGGISMSVPMENLRTIERSRMIELTFAHVFLWAVGLAGIVIGNGRLRVHALGRKRLEDELLTLSITDSLTGLRNRRGFLALAEHELRLSARTKRKLILMFADLDGLKAINDEQGHKEGDRAIAETAAVLRETFRSSDIMARMGGDEFAVLAVEPGDMDPQTVVLRLQDRVEIHNADPDRNFRLSISIGCVLYDPENPCSLDDLMSRADKLMYQHKNGKKFFGN